MQYLLDSDVLIAAKNLYYKPGFCGKFWEWVTDGHSGGVIFSIDKVRQELLSGEPHDHLVQWTQDQQEGFFLSTKGTLAKWKDLSVWASTKQPKYIEGAKDKFLAVDAADAWLVAFAAHHGNFTIVTNEKSEPASKKSIKLPDAAAALKVPTMTLFDLLDICAHKNFTFQSYP